MKTIKSRILLYAILNLFIILFIFIGFSILMISLGNKNLDLLDKRANFSKLTIFIEQEKNGFEQYVRTKDGQYYQDYLDKQKEINFILENMKTNSQKNENILRYIRTISTMHNHIIKITSNIISKEVLTQKDNEEILYTLLVYTKMNEQAQELMMADIEISNNEYYNVYSTYKNHAVLLLIIIIPIILIINSIILLILSSINKNLQNIIENASSLSNEKWEIDDIEETPYIELNSVSLALNNMKHRILDYIIEIKKQSDIEINLHKNRAEVEKKDRLLKQTQLNYLRMQINPHFLFNTLNIIAKSSVLQNTELSLQIIEDISKILRYSLDRHEKVVPIDEEIEITQSYISIQQVRFQDQIEFEFIIDDNIKNIYVPPMIIQPLIENSITHGFINKYLDCYIKIEITILDRFLYIIVKDNGQGFKNENFKNRKNIKGKGLYNVYQRLLLQYKSENVMNIESKKDEYTIVTLMIPVSNK